MKAYIFSSLVKVFSQTEPNFPEISQGSALTNERFSFQVVLFPEAKEETKAEISTDSPLGESIKLFAVKEIPAGKNGYDTSDSFHYDLSTKKFPDLLEPTEGKVTLKKGKYNAFWLQCTPDGSFSGDAKIKITITTPLGVTQKEFTLHITDAAIPKQTLLYTNWFHNDCLCTHYGVEPFSEDYWEIFEAFVKNAADHGINMLLTPVFTPPLDTKVGGERPTVQLVGVEKKGKEYSFDFTNFRKYVDICLKNGIEAFEISHLFTQWGAEFAPKIVAGVNGKEKRIFGWDTKATSKAYTDFLEAFAKEFKKTVTEMGIKERCWIHVSDEPSENQLKSYKKAAEIVHRLFKGFNMLDALSEVEYYKQGIIKTPVCGEQLADIFRKEVKNFWTYCCCSQHDMFAPNRFFSHPSVRNRITGMLLYKYQAQGFLQWGHNFWYSQYSIREIDPFKVTDAGDAFPSGDSFMVYPGKDRKPLNSLRLIVFAEALQDMRALQLLESLTSRKYALKVLEQGLDIPLSFTTYPHEEYWLREARERINREIEKALNK